MLLYSVVISALFSTALRIIGGHAIRSFIANTDYTEWKDNRKISELQDYITENHISAGDSEELTKWVKKQSVVMIQVYRNGFIVYDSMYPKRNFYPEERDRYDWGTFYTLEFSDGSAEVVLYGFYDYIYYHHMMIINIVLSFSLFLGMVMLGIRKTIHYIRKLSQEIKILEGGDLNYPITVMGRDELAQLAEGLDSMRQSFRRQTEEEKQLMLASQRMITEMSHDLRTPLTSIMLYTEILLKNKCESKEQRTAYIQKIDKKARRLKQLSDHLFEYALIAGTAEVKLEKPLGIAAVFYDLLSETVSYLEEQGFCAALDFVWKECCIQINRDYIIRIFDNLTSNIVKYADCGSPVRIQSMYFDSSVGIVVKNKKKTADAKTESSKIGLQNIQKMMEKMGGRADVEDNDEIFILTLIFPVV